MNGTPCSYARLSALRKCRGGRRRLTAHIVANARKTGLAGPHKSCGLAAFPRPCAEPSALPPEGAAPPETRSVSGPPPQAGAGSAQGRGLSETRSGAEGRAIKARVYPKRSRRTAFTSLRAIAEVPQSVR